MASPRKLSALRLPIRAALWSLWLLACSGGAGAGGGLSARDAAGGAPTADLGFGGGSDGLSRDADPGTDVPVPIADAGTSDAFIGCESDESCGEGAFCEEGTCHPAVATLPALDDGVFRAGASRFDVAPVFFEPWTDRAGPECAGNRAGAYDGPLVLDATPPGPCDDFFDDVDRDGHFDAMWMAGAGADRPAAGVDEENPPAGRVLFVQRNAEIWALVTLDVYAIGPEPLQALTRGLQLRLGLPEGRIAVHATGVRSAPDAVGMWGPTLALAEGPLGALKPYASTIPLLAHVPVETGLDREWWREVRRRVAVAAQQALANVKPVTLRAARVRLPEPAGGPGGPGGPADDAPTSWSAEAAEIVSRLAEPTLYSHDVRFPLQRDLDVRVAAFDAADGAPLAVLAVWGATPAVGGAEGRLSADLGGRVRAGLEAAYPGALGFWLTGASSEEVLAGAGARVPETDEDGRPGEEMAAAPGPALARLVVGAARRALEGVEGQIPTLEVRARYAWLTITNPRYDLAARLGVISGLSDWVAGRRTTPVWAGATTAPACGAMGCLRYRLDRVDLGAVRLLTTPGGLDEGFVQGRAESTLTLTDPESRNLTDLDLDGVIDADDPEILLESRDVAMANPIRIGAPLNPQRFAPLQPLEDASTWLLGRTNGGLGSLRAATDVVNVYEGQAKPLEALLASAPELAALDLCLEGYDCDRTLSLAELVPQVTAELPEILSDLPGGHLLALTADPGEVQTESARFRVEAPGGGLRGEGQGVVLGPGPWAFALSTDFGLAGVMPGDQLVLTDDTRLGIDRVVPVELARHPNAGDQWRGPHARGGDAVYNAACELLNGGLCPYPRVIPAADDPNATLPRQPEDSPASMPAGRGDRPVP
jgi:hypothetical protein